MPFWLLRWMSIWPPFFFSGIRVKADRDLRRFEVTLKQRWWNKNFVGTAFGGTLYSMSDPFYMLMFLANLGKGFVVWDKSACIRFRKPGRGQLKAIFRLSPEEINSVREEALREGKVEKEYTVEIRDLEGEVVASVDKLIYIRAKGK